MLGWAEWREVDARHWLGLVTAALQAAMDAGQSRRADVQPLAHMLMGAMVEASMLIANAADPRAARGEVEGPLLRCSTACAPDGPYPWVSGPA